MRHGSLFSGIGGFDLAAQWMGWENIFHCEWNPFGKRLLKYYWPNAISYEDICATDFTIHRGSIDILTGGFPCQPYSTAGKRLGKADERHLFPQMLRAIKEIKPRWVVGENVRGLISWNGGLVFDEVCTDLEGQGYEVIPFLIPACAVNAPHRRDRVWFVAKNSNKNGWRSNKWEKKSSEWEQRESSTGNYERICRKEMAKAAANASDTGLQRSKNQRVSEDSRKETHKQSTRRILPNWEKFPTVSPICHGDDGLPDRLDGITFSKWRNESIKGGGNAIVPQVVLQIFKSIEAYEKH